MKLTGKAKEQFEKWLLQENGSEQAYLSCVRVAPEIGDKALLKAWRNLPDSMQWGVIQDWADSLMIDVNVEGYDLQKEFDYVIKQGATSEETEHFLRGNSISVSHRKRPDNKIMSASTFITRQEARNAAIEKLNETLNQNK